MSALAGALRIRRANSLRPFTIVRAFIRRDWAIAWSYRLPFAIGLVQGFATVGFLYFLGHLVGPRVHAANADLQNGYFSFAVVGTTLLAFFTVTLTAFAQRLRTDQTTGTLEVLFTMPPSPTLTVLGSASYQLFYATIANFLTVGLAVALGMRFSTSAQGVALALGAFLVSLGFFCAVGIAFAAFVMVFKRGETLTALGTSVLLLVGGVYYPISLMPRGLRILADLVPFTWALEVIRSSLLSGGLPLGRFAELCAASAVALPLAVWIFSVSLNRARRLGSLGQY
jgi:ABC-2 type transport system permease protein